jgi:hypothetical protein
LISLSQIDETTSDYDHEKLQERLAKMVGGNPDTRAYIQKQGRGALCLGVRVGEEPATLRRVERRGS